MIGLLKGDIVSLHPDHVLIDVAGVGYEVFLSKRTIDDLSGQRNTITLHIHTHITESSMSLYGFIKEVEKSFFKTLIMVSGVGPKVALQMLSGLSCEAIITALLEEDIPLLTSLNGIGKKTAQRLVVELRDKLDGFSKLIPLESKSLTQNLASGFGGNYNEALSALMNLGYTKPIAEKALSQIPMQNNMKVEDILKTSFNYLSKQAH